MVGFPKVFQVHMAVLKLRIQETKTISHNKTWSYNRLKLIIFKKLWQKLVGFLRSFQACIVVLNSKSNIQKNPTINKNFTTIEAHHLQAVCSLMCFSQSDHQLLTSFLTLSLSPNTFIAKRRTLIPISPNVLHGITIVPWCVSKCPCHALTSFLMSLSLGKKKSSFFFATCFLYHLVWHSCIE
jgi:hypothetical protein